MYAMVTSESVCPTSRLSYHYYADLMLGSRKSRINSQVYSRACKSFLPIVLLCNCTALVHFSVVVSRGVGREGLGDPGSF